MSPELGRRRRRFYNTLLLQHVAAVVCGGMVGDGGGVFSRLRSISESERAITEEAPSFGFQAPLFFFLLILSFFAPTLGKTPFVQGSLLLFMSACLISFQSFRTILLRHLRRSLLLSDALLPFSLHPPELSSLLLRTPHERIYYLFYSKCVCVYSVYL